MAEIKFLSLAKAIQFQDLKAIRGFAICRVADAGGRPWWTIEIKLLCTHKMLHTSRGILKMYDSLDTVARDIERIAGAGAKVELRLALQEQQPS